MEKDIQRQIIEWLRLKNIYCWKQNNVGIQKPNGQYIPSGLVGVSDILGVLPNGTFLAIEVKRPGGLASEAQTQFLLQIKKNNGHSFIATSLQDVIDNFNEHDIC